MKSSSQIKFDFNNATQQARRLEELADQVEKDVVRGLEENIQMLRVVWTGEAARGFVRKEEQLHAQVKESAAELRHIAEDIRRIARRVYDSEMRALEIARRRVSGGGGGR